MRSTLQHDPSCTSVPKIHTVLRSYNLNLATNFRSTRRVEFPGLKLKLKWMYTVFVVEDVHCMDLSLLPQAFAFPVQACQSLRRVGGP